MAIFYRQFHGDRQQGADAAHETMVRLFQNFDFTRPERERVLPTYLFRVVRSVSADQRRAARAQKVSDEIVEPADPTPSVEDRQMWMDSRAELQAQLQGNDRQLFDMILDEVEVSEIARQLGISVEAAYQRISRIRKRVKALIAQKH
jgi:RNA polymerase sigma factor (sigma-70 family)